MLRCAVLKHLRQETWRGLEFTLRDSASARRFVRADPARLPRKSALQATVGAVAPDTWERVNRCLLRTARDSGVETGARLLIDSTVTETHILPPVDSRLLYDGIRVLARLLGQARQHLGGAAIAFHDHRRAAKRRHLEVRTQRGRERRAHTYRRLLRLARRTLGYVDGALPAVAPRHAPWAQRWKRDVAHYADLLRRVMDQAERRVLQGESVPAADKIVSLFEPHTDIVRKGGRDTFYGHKVNLATGRSGLVLDAVVETGNPPDSTRCLAMLARHQEHYGAVPSHAAFDGGYASRDNLAQAKALGVAHVVFHKKSGLKQVDMTPSSWLYDQLKRFHAGIEAGISYLKRCFGLGRCRCRGLTRFKAHVHSAVFAHNLVRLARLRPRPT